MATSSDALSQDVSSERNFELASSLDSPKKDKELSTRQGFSSLQRYLILILVSFAGVLAPIGSAIYYPSLLDIQRELHASSISLDLTVSGFLATMAVAPLGWGSMSDTYGRRLVYISSLVLFILSSLGCGLSNSITMLIAMRLIQGVGSSAAMVAGVGTISDIFVREERGSAMGWFLIGPLIGPVMGPLIGGYVNQYLGWRVIFYILAGLGATILLGIVLILPETLADSKRQPFPLHLIKSLPFIHKRGPLLNPFVPLNYLGHIKVSLVVFYVSIVFAAYYLISSTQTSILSKVYRLTSSEVGLSYLPLGLGNLIGSLVGGRFSDLILRYETKRLGGSPRPEVRLYGVCLGIISITSGLFMVGWFLEFRFPLAAALFSQFLVGLGMLFIFSGTSIYLIDLYPNKSASIIACNNCCRTIAAAITTSLASLMMNNLSYGWAFSIFGFLQLPGFLIITFLIFFGHRILN